MNIGNLKSFVTYFSNDIFKPMWRFVYSTVAVCNESRLPDKYRGKLRNLKQDLKVFYYAAYSILFLKQ